MKKIKKLIIWTMIPVTLELCGFMYVDRVYLAQNNKVEIVKVENKVKETPKLQNIKISEKAKNIKVSYDGKYASYDEDGNLKLIDFRTGTTMNIDKEKSSSISYYTWLPDRNRIYIAEKRASKNGKSYIKMYSYDVDKKEKYEWEDNHQNKTEIELQNKQSEVKEIAISTLSGLAYIKIEGSDNKSIVYRVDVMTQIEKAKTKNSLVGSIGVTPTDDRLIYEDKKANKLYIEGYSNNSKPLNNLLFIGVDYDNLIYVGVKQGDKISEIQYGTVETPMEQWKKINLNKHTLKEDIHITLKGNVYLDNAEGHNIEDLQSGKKITYEGKLIAICESSIVYLKDNNLFKVPIK